MEIQNKKRLDREFEIFSTRNFEKPRKCRNLDQIRYYVQELSYMIDSYKQNFGYVPDSAYELLAQYNHEQNKWINASFRSTYV